MNTILTQNEIYSIFPKQGNKVILSSCSQSAMSTVVLNAIDEYKESLLEYGMAWDLWMNKVESAKRNFARLIHCDPEEVAILSSVSDCVSSILHSLKLSGKEICLTDLDFPCVGHAVLAQRNQQDFSIKYIPHHQYTIPIERYDEFVNTKTVLTCIPHISYYNGFKQDIKNIAKICHDKGSLLLVDAYQSAGSMNINVRDMDIDILVTGMQKYLLGIPGISFLYVKKELATQLQPSTIGWFGQEKPFDFNLKELQYAHATQRFNTGTPPVINAYAADAALSLINQIGMTRIEEYVNQLSSYTVKRALELEMELISPKTVDLKGPTTAIYVGDAHKVEQELREIGFIVSARKDVIRIAPHIYNKEEEIENALQALLKLTS
ncbi:aminotransferase class V-fold PLP-dependent enzyme [Pseudoneobacillus sp. C159]